MRKLEFSRKLLFDYYLVTKPYGLVTCNSDETLSFFDNDLKSIFEFTKMPTRHISYLNNQIWAFDNERRKGCLIQLPHFEIVFEFEKEPLFSGLTNLLFKNYSYGFTRDDHNNLIGAKYNLITKKIEEKYELNLGLNGVWYVINEEYFLSKNREFLTLHDFEGKEIWRFDPYILDDTGKEKKEDPHNWILILFANEEYAIVRCEYGTVRFDTLTGKIIWHTPDWLDYKNERYFCFLSDVIKEYDIQNGSVIWEKGIEEEMNNHKCRIMPNDFDFFDDEHIVFLNYTSKVAMLNIKTGKIVWKYEFPHSELRNMNFSIGSLQVQDKKIHLVDENDILHIFEQVT